MRDITQIDWNGQVTKVVGADPAKQKVFFMQDGIEYDSAGKACNQKQVKAYLAKQAADLQAQADAAKEAAAEAQKNADAVMKSAGVTKAAVKKAAAK